MTKKPSSHLSGSAGQGSRSLHPAENGTAGLLSLDEAGEKLASVLRQCEQRLNQLGLGALGSLQKRQLMAVMSLSKANQEYLLAHLRGTDQPTSHPSVASHGRTEQ